MNIGKNVLWKEHLLHGKILTDKEGMTLYFFSLDTKGDSTCMDKCIDYWPIFYEKDVMPEIGLEAKDFGSIKRADGKMQTTYKGWPLYYYKDDKIAGEAKGEAENNIWFVAKPDYSLMYVKAQLIGDNGKEYTSKYKHGKEETFYITDINGRTLYLFEKDTKNKNNYTKSDFSNNALWPIFECNELGKIPSVLKASDFSMVDVFGKKQLAYRGWPMYYFEKDTKRGDNKGISFPLPGVWPIANLDTVEAK